MISNTNLYLLYGNFKGVENKHKIEFQSYFTTRAFHLKSIVGKNCEKCKICAKVCKNIYFRINIAFVYKKALIRTFHTRFLTIK